MYNQFTKSLDNFIALNAAKDEYRYKLVKSIEPLKSIETFLALKQLNALEYEKLQKLIWEIGENINEYPSFKVFSWELWGYGFDGQNNNVAIDDLDEKLKLIDLLLSTQYWH
ncbi:hypothetical protein KHM83_19450 [Fusibacter paucivorans]|uniref:Uncharacterized protein n=1 Tax=Fusibacter paucivorans TaxID=76009 RepID=A0ABS5PV84_9FIRM|nr:hypothetical protein [Fusibacter paucivorans]MBS7528847.1 hypothetical protein [Fusibacter paucivorans]